MLAICDVHIVPWRITFGEVKIFQKGAQRWITMPSREFINDLGEKKYVELITFDNDGVRNRFRNQVMDAIDKFLASNPDMTPEPVIKEFEEPPF